MKTYELHLAPSKFDPLYQGNQSAVNADMTTPAIVGHHLLVQEYSNNTFTGRWVRLQITHVEKTATHSQILSVRTLVRSTEKVLRKNAA
jgi:hypothetical protein